MKRSERSLLLDQLFYGRWAIPGNLSAYALSVYIKQRRIIFLKAAVLKNSVTFQLFYRCNELSLAH